MVRQRQGKARRAVVPFTKNITMKITFRVKFTPKVYSKGQLCRVPHLRKSYLVQKYGGRYSEK